ncbi:LOW QUALITY PROTEIN: Hypothetical protein PHPALM_3227 [Phytophthora palmivora]|uniref:Uncharacterized protein n=1 Tax=Phytophthora palmivora TaxID=4796 RepID=A0A2P4YMZ6_9STRA|nr:LOW QUALITY PROTEIN: Hypothetical protein PHPALM_3227 [Phytophthora palmivora]
MFSIENPLIYMAYPLFSVTGEISTDTISTRRMLVDCGATTNGVSKRDTISKFEYKIIRVRLGDNQIVETELEVVHVEIISDLGEACKHVAVDYTTPNDFDGILRRSTNQRDEIVDYALRTNRRYLRIEEDRPVNASGLRRSVEAKGLSSKRSDSLRGAALETDVTSVVRFACDAVQKVSPTVVREQQQDASAGKRSAVNGDKESSKREGTSGSAADGNITRGKDVEKMYGMGVVDAVDVHTILITRKKLNVQRDDRVARTLQTKDQTTSVVTAKARRYLETGWENVQDNPAVNLLMAYKENVFGPEPSEDLLEKRKIKPRIDATMTTITREATWNCTMGHHHGEKENHPTKYLSTRRTDVLCSETSRMGDSQRLPMFEFQTGAAMQTDGADVDGMAGSH